MESQAREAYVVFAAEYGPDGKSLGEETKERCRSAAVHLINNPYAVVLLAAGTLDTKKGRLPLAELMQDYMMEITKIPRYYFIICGAAPNTLSEIDAVEAYLNKEWDIDRVIAVSSWYHLPRIVTSWLLRHGRPVALKPVWIFSPVIFKRAALEPAKMLLTAIPISNERKVQIGQWFRRRKLI